MAGRLAQVFDSIPWAVRLIISLNMGAFIATMVSDDGIQANALCLEPIWPPWKKPDQAYRLITNAFTHIGILHLLLNMMSAVSIGALLEKYIGTIAMIGLTTLSTVTIAVLYIALQYAEVIITGDARHALECAVGFSANLFAWAVLETALDGAQRSVFGFFSVPGWLYPWVLLAIIQIIMPGASFQGHLCGLLFGWMYAKGLLLWLTPPRKLIGKLDAALPQFLTSSPAWVDYPSSNDPLRHCQFAFISGSEGSTWLASMIESLRESWSSWQYRSASGGQYGRVVDMDAQSDNRDSKSNTHSKDMPLPGQGFRLGSKSDLPSAAPSVPVTAAKNYSSTFSV